jgi:hypothetical protein
MQEPIRYCPYPDSALLSPKTHRSRARMAALSAPCNRSASQQGGRGTPSRRMDVCSDPDDNVFLEYADKAGADYLVIGNCRHFPKFWKKTKIITAREFISPTAPHLIL